MGGKLKCEICKNDGRKLILIKVKGRGKLVCKHCKADLEPNKIADVEAPFVLRWPLMNK
jgi:ribosome-binding protein aMBF1 (putative translation factor)